jgi:hypothetical protein
MKSHNSDPSQHRNGVSLSAIAAAVCLLAHGRSADAQAVPLQTYTASDQSVTVGLASGWRVVEAARSVVTISGPNGESIALGPTYVARNAAYQLKGSGGADLDMPYSASLAQKFAAVMNYVAAARGQGAVQFTVTNGRALAIPANIASCAQAFGNTGSASAPMKFEAVFCSLPLDSGGLYKNMYKLAIVPAAQAAADQSIAEAIMASYRLPPNVLQQKIAPVTPGPVQAAAPRNAQAAPTQQSLAQGALQLQEAQMIMRQTNMQAQASSNQANCFDLSVLRQTPDRLLPAYCR